HLGGLGRGRGGQLVPARLAVTGVSGGDRGTAGGAGGHQNTVRGRTALAWSTSAYRANGSGSRVASARYARSSPNRISRSRSARPSTRPFVNGWGGRGADGRTE